MEKGRHSPDFLCTVTWDYVVYYQSARSKEMELPGVTTLNVVGVFVTDAQFLILKAVASWVRQLGVSSSLLTAVVEALLSCYG